MSKGGQIKKKRGVNLRKNQIGTEMQGGKGKNKKGQWL